MACKVVVVVVVDCWPAPVCDWWNLYACKSKCGLGGCGVANGGEDGCCRSRECPVLGSGSCCCWRWCGDDDGRRLTFCSDVEAAVEDNEDTDEEEPGAVTNTRGVANWRADAEEEEVEAGGPGEVEESAVETEGWSNMVR